jgi:hypothetical protein
MIFFVRGPNGRALKHVAAGIRSLYASQNKGFLYIDDRDAPSTEAEAKTDREKQVRNILKRILYDGDSLDASNASFENVSWMHDAGVIVVLDHESILDELEAVMPGFREKYGPEVQVTVEAPDDEVEAAPVEQVEAVS